jgi:hypothetical protein
MLQVLGIDFVLFFYIIQIQGTYMPIFLSPAALEIPFGIRLVAAKAVVTDISTRNVVCGYAEWSTSLKAQQAFQLASGDDQDLCNVTKFRIKSFYNVLCALGYEQHFVSTEIAS